MNLDELEKLHPQAWKALTLILAGKPQLSIPPQPGDSDKVISACLDALPLLIAVAREAKTVMQEEIQLGMLYPELFRALEALEKP